MELIFGILLIALLFGFSIFIHELGHFWVAKKLGLQIDAFSVGFGPAIIKKEIDGVVWKISWIPLGGYVALPQMDPTGGQMATEQGREMPSITPGKKIAVAVAGAVMNVLFAFVLALIIWQIGKPTTPAEIYPTVGYVDLESTSYEAGLRMGDDVIEVEGRTVANWQEVLIECSLTDEAVDLKVLREGKELAFTVPLEKMSWGIWSIPGVSGLSYCRVASVLEGYSAIESGVEMGDLLVGVQGERLYSHDQLRQAIKDKEGQAVTVTVDRNGETFDFDLQPRTLTRELKIRQSRDGVTGFFKDLKDPEYEVVKTTNDLIGVGWDPTGYDLENLDHPSPMAMMKVWAGHIFRVLDALTTPSQAGNAAKGLSGPVGIIMMFWWMKESIGLALWFTGLLNINLAIINMLPIPILDGGHVVFALIEKIRKRPVPIRIVMGLTQVFVVLLLSAFAVLTFRDVDRFILEPILGPKVEVLSENIGQ